MNSANTAAAGGSRRMGFDKLSALLGEARARPQPASPSSVAPTSLKSSSSPRRIASRRALAAEAGFPSSRLSSGRRGASPLCVERSSGRIPRKLFFRRIMTARVSITLAAISRCLLPLPSTARLTTHPIADTLKRADADRRVVGSVSRDDLWAMETPQCFETGLLRRAYERILDGGDPANATKSPAVEALGEPWFFVENPEPNPKITYPADLKAGGGDTCGATVDRSLDFEVRAPLFRESDLLSIPQNEVSRTKISAADIQDQADCPTASGALPKNDVTVPVRPAATILPRRETGSELRPKPESHRRKTAHVCIGCGVLPTPLRAGKFAVRRRTSPHASEAGESVSGFLLAIVQVFVVRQQADCFA
ncbi:MAG: 2-C-methyl-D-erythritol 4-phosphate cytidylyltransferase [Akkermansiaceae bacterium]|nr:2-C-methyl-D-erythritol 4-phosphate cytidylyltransferase [Akkermansiaceae bacterium]